MREAECRRREAVTEGAMQLDKPERAVALGERSSPAHRESAPGSTRACRESCRNKQCCGTDKVACGSEWEAACLGSNRDENLVLWLEDSRRQQGSGKGSVAWGCVGALCTFFTGILELARMIHVDRWINLGENG